MSFKFQLPEVIIRGLLEEEMVEKVGEEIWLKTPIHPMRKKLRKKTLSYDYPPKKLTYPTEREKENHQLKYAKHQGYMSIPWRV